MTWQNRIMNLHQYETLLLKNIVFCDVLGCRYNIFASVATHGGSKYLIKKLFCLANYITIIEILSFMMFYVVRYTSFVSRCNARARM